MFKALNFVIFCLLMLILASYSHVPKVECGLVTLGDSEALVIADETVIYKDSAKCVINDSTLFLNGQFVTAENDKDEEFIKFKEQEYDGVQIVGTISKEDVKCYVDNKNVK